MEKPKKDQYISLGTGLILVIISIILLGAKINPPLIVINIEIEAGWVDVNLTFLIWIIMFIIGIVVLIKGITPKSNLFENTPSFKIKKELDDYEYKSEKKVRISNFAWFQLVCSILLIIVAIIQYIEWGADFSFENEKGNWIYLGGPSLFYATSFFPTFYAVGLMLYALFSQKNIIFQETKESYVICEKRFTLKNYTEIPKDKITAVFISNTKTGVRFLWQVVVNLIVLMILLLSPISYLEIHNNEKRYIIKFISIKKKGKKQSDIAKLVEYFNIKNDNSGYMVQHQAKFTFKKLLRTQLVIGLIFITIAILSRVFNFYAGGILRLPLFLSGILLITKGIKKNFLHIKPPYSYWQVKDKKGLLDKRSFLCFNEIAWFSENEGNQSNKISHLDQIDFYDYIIIAILPTMMLLNLLSLIILTPSTYSGIYYKILIFIILSGIILYLLWKMYLRPRGFLKFSTAYENFYFSLNDNIQHSIKNPILRKKGIFRLSISVGCSILASIFYIISVFF
ncbi:MAG: hypothetical protein ACTSRX_02195 [Promethearchaeota archaeon]